MKIKNLFVVALASIVALAACKKEPVVTPPADLTIKLNAAVYGFTKATDTAFEAGDAMGVNVYEGENSYIFNAKFTYNGSALTSVTEYKWYEDTETVGTITAYYPYVSLSESATALTFTVNTDQSSAEKYKGSDFMVATTSSKPTEEAINLNFKHALSKVVVTVDNQLSEAIQDVWLTDVLGSVTFDLKTGAVAATGSQGNVKGYKSSDNTWQLIIAPQTANPKLALTTASGKQYTFVLSEGVTFSAGKYSTAAVTVNDATVSTLFTPNIENWVADNELNFGQDEILDNDDNLNGDDNGENNGEENGEENGDDNGENNGENEGEGNDENGEENGNTEQNPTPGTSNVLYFNPGPDWIVDSPRYEAYFFVDDTTYTWEKMTDTDSDGIYECTVPEGYTKVIFCRMNPNGAEASWDSKWNQTEDLTITAEFNLYTMKDWNTGEWSVKQ